MECPCRYCEKKGCGAYHSQCEKYKEFELEREGIRHRIRLEKEITYHNKRRKKEWQK